ncbi:uncharacterized protein LOC123564076 [Mercenaria mercenaria]|uniref:uncharacterized protein LOC123564076 n=1 Tax=Mercenaria mercenaria TaxID=6596 RepID=UPI00234F7E69|nr:uncharacterized protein LOC123564076 [Mercenaria mercenaria]
MIAEEDEYFLRASILLLKGGRLVSKETLYKELRKAGRNLDVLLKQHERKFKYKFVKKQREKLFPDAGVTDVETWDLAMLTTVTLTVFKQSLNDDEKNDLKSIKCMRDEIYAHTYSSSLSADQYEEIRKELQNALTSLSNGLSEKLKDDCLKIIQECTTGPISPSLKAELTKQIEDTEHSLLAVMNKLRNQEEFLCEMKKDIMDTLNKMRVTEDRSEKIIKVIDTELTLSGAVNESKSIDFAEEIITKVINKAIKKVGNENDYPRIRGVVDKILKDIENMPDVEILPAEHKCILLKFRCTTYIGISNILMYLESRSFLDSLNDLALALSSTLPNMSGQYRLDVTVTPECMKDLLDELRAKTMETTKYERTIRVPIKVKSVQGIEHIWSLFETGGATVRLNELSEAVFNELNTKITVKPSVNLEQIQAAIKEAGKKSAKVSHEDVEDNASFPHRLQSKSVVEVCRSYDDSDVKETVIGTKNASFETRNRRAFDTNDPLFEPEEIGSFSLDINRKYDNTTKQLKYFVKPPANRVHFDLRKGYSTMIRKDESKPDFITDILRWITDNKEKLVEQDIKTKR